MRNLLAFIFVFAAFQVFAQGKKDIKKYNIKAVTITKNEDGKSLTEEKSVYDKNGRLIELTDYNKDGQIKTIHKYKYNKSGDII